MKRTLTCALILAAATAPSATGGSSGASLSPTMPELQDSGTLPYLAATSPGQTAAGQTAAGQNAGDQDAAGEDAAELAQEFEARFGAPSSRQYDALSAPMRAAFQRYFLRGRGAVPAGGAVDWAAGSVGAGTGSEPGSPLFLFGDPVPGFPGLFNIALGNTGSGYLEYFVLQVPHHMPTGPTPLLVVFHQYGVSHADAPYHTNFCEEARERNWFMVAPYGASQTNFGSLPSQINTNAVLDWARANLPIAANRIYGVGFSMGGGGVASYAARHLDPDDSNFAAIVNHTGTVSLIHAYANEGFAIQTILEGWFGGSPAAQPFAYRRCSTIDIDPLTELVGVGTDMGRNLKYVRSWLADQDPQPYLPLETQLFATHMLGLNPANVLTTVSGNVHSWNTLDDTIVCDWLAQYTLQEPLIGNTLADRNGAWHRFRVEQDAPGAFTPFSWFSTPSANRLNLWATGNLKRLSVDCAPLGLVYSGALKLNMSTADATGDEVLFLHVPSAPISVTRNGAPSATPVYNAQLQTLLVPEASGAGAQWVFNF